MTEKNLLINHKKISYQGHFRTGEILSTINKALLEKGYSLREKKSEELVAPQGRMLKQELRPFKNVSQYVSLMLKIHLIFDNVTEVHKEIAGVKHKFQQGDLTILFDAWSLTDYEGRWGTKPLAYFLKALVHKYFYKFPLEEGFVQQLVSDTAYVYAQTNLLLHSYSEQKAPAMTEEEIRSKMEEEILSEAEPER